MFFTQKFSFVFCMKFFVLYMVFMLFLYFGLDFYIVTIEFILNH